jgi:hypothetical protein
LEAEVALASLTVPCVGAMTVSELTWTRIPSYFSSWSIGPFGSVFAAVRVIASGRELPLEITDTLGVPAISVDGGLLGSAEG